MKYLFIISVVLFQLGANAQKSLCGVTKGFSYNQDSIVRPYSLSGFWVKQNTKDIRVTYGSSPELIEIIQDIISKNKGSLFICLDSYELIEKKYSGKNRIYAHTTDFRIWLNGERVEL